jgi:hypothetical protein
VSNRDILTALIKGAVTTFKGLSGTLSTAETGSLGDSCTAFYHESAPANIISFFQLRSLGHTIELITTEDTDAFLVTTLSSAYTLRQFNFGLYVYTPPARNALIITVKSRFQDSVDYGPTYEEKMIKKKKKKKKKGLR